MPTPDWPVINPFKPQTTTSYYSGQKLLTSSIKSYSADAHRKCLEELEEQSITHHFIAVPKVVWTPRHRKEIELQVGELLNKPIGNVKWIKPTGSTLCTEQEWNTFLDYEEWNRLGFERQDAANLAAERKGDIKSKNPLLAAERKRVLDEHPLYGVKATQGTDVQRKKAAKNFLRLNKPHPHRTRAEKRISDVERAIVSVFPSFSLFSSK